MAGTALYPSSTGEQTALTSEWAFMGTPICPLSLDQLEEQLCREQPWLRHDGHTSLPPRLLLEAAARAAKTEARRASGALAKAERAARNARAAAEAQHRRAADAEEAARIGLGAKSLMEAAAAAHEAAEREAVAAEAAKELAQRYHEAALSKSLAARYFWDGQMNDEDELQRQLQQAASKSAGRSPIGGWVPGTSNTAHFQDDSSEGFTCSDFTSSRSSRAAHRVSRPEDFMDQEDMEQAARGARKAWHSGQLQHRHNEWESGAEAASSSKGEREHVLRWSRVESRREGLPVFVGTGRPEVASGV
ncbi:hypothetical protein, conserved [Eimeria necatrix]|uniref:G patch domain-containing protein n=1 Tax=Eimeria necatrix TaxID=51315 RepID=U6MVN7_9EIME|nr:hypothetical protein, conserved [Eimeria necatrix]CDJ67058.1 hypothetical protein, conserved [Eimeria necatrix]